LFTGTFGKTWTGFAFALTAGSGSSYKKKRIRSTGKKVKRAIRTQKHTTEQPHTGTAVKKIQ
jgi:hypothetical protein